MRPGCTHGAGACGMGRACRILLHFALFLGVGLCPAAAPITSPPPSDARIERTPPPGVLPLRLMPSPVIQGSEVTVQVSLPTPVGPGGAVLAIRSSHPEVVIVPEHVPLGQGVRGTAFSASTRHVAAATTVTITVSDRDATGSAALLVLPSAVLHMPTGNGVASDAVYNPSNGHWYQAVQAAAPLGWAEADLAAQLQSFAGLPGHLLTVTSEEENLFLRNNLHAIGQRMWWIGGFQDDRAADYREPGRGWRWVTGEPFLYQNWSSNAPDNRNPAENFLATYTEGRWNDYHGGVGLGGYLVEYEPALPPQSVRVQVTPDPMVAGTAATGIVTLPSPAGPGDAVVRLAVSDRGVAVPTAVTVPAGALTASFPVIALLTSSPMLATITASIPGSSGSTTLRVLPENVAERDSLLVNGSFELPRARFSPFRISHESGLLAGWQILSGVVELVTGETWENAPGEGSQSLAGSAPASIRQEFATIPAREYVFSGWMAHRPGIPVGLYPGRADLYLNEQFLDHLTHEDREATRAHMLWRPFAYRFRAVGTRTSIRISHARYGPETWGLVLDGLAVTPASLNLLGNGSFELPDGSAPGDSVRRVGPGGLPGWQVVRGSVDVVHERHWQPARASGRQSLELVGVGSAGGIEQTISTVPGRLYAFSGWLSHSVVVPEGRVEISLNGLHYTRLTHSNQHDGATIEREMYWRPFALYFQATTPATTLQLTDVSEVGNGGGAVLDDLAVTPVDGGVATDGAR